MFRHTKTFMNADNVPTQGSRFSILMEEEYAPAAHTKKTSSSSSLGHREYNDKHKTSKLKREYERPSVVANDRPLPSAPTLLEGELYEQQFPSLSKCTPNVSAAVSPQKEFVDTFYHARTSQHTKNTPSNNDHLSNGWVVLQPFSHTVQTNAATSTITEGADEDEMDYTGLIHKLVNMYEQNTMDYINLYGIDDWERCYKFANYAEWEMIDSEEDSCGLNDTDEWLEDYRGGEFDPYYKCR